MQNPNMLYKLILLYILDSVDYQMTNSQLSEYLISKEYTDYFTTQQEISSLIDVGYINQLNENGKTLYEISQEGISALKSLSSGRISDTIKLEINNFLKERGYDFRSDNFVTCTYDKNLRGDDYLVTCKIKERDYTLLNMTISVPDEKQAIKCKENWRKNKNKIYQDIMKNLL